MGRPEAGARGRRGTWAALLATSVALACGGGGGGGADRGGTDGAGRVEGEAPLRRVEEPTSEWEVPRRLVLVRSVPGRVGLDGGEEGGPDFAPAGIRDLAPAPGGRILVLDGDRSRVVVLDARGTVSRRVARPGQGPGELRAPGRVEPAPGGGLLVLERRPPAVHRWDSDGDFLGSTRLRLRGDRDPGAGLAEWGPRLPGGRAVRLVSLDPADPSGSRSTLYVADSTGTTGPAVVSWRAGGTRSRLPEIFGARRSWAASVAEDGSPRLLVARGDRYELRRYDASGRLIDLVRRDARRLPVSERLRRRALDRFVEEARRGGAPPGLAERLRGRVPVADRLPAVAEIWSSRTDGRVWVGLPGVGEPGGPPSAVRAYDVFGPSLAYLGRVPAPPGFRLHRVRGDLLYGSWLNELGVPGVRVYRLTAGEGSPPRDGDAPGPEGQPVTPPGPGP